MKRTRPNRRKAPRRELPKLPKLPSLPRVTVNFRALFAVVAVTAVFAIAGALGRELLELPVRQLRIEGNFQRVSKLEIEAVSDALGQSFLSADLDEIRARIASLPWVDTVKLRRIWPDTLRISYSEHSAAARWGDSGLLNTRGELFAEDLGQEYRELPNLAGPDGSLHRVAARYIRISNRLASTSLILDSIRMDARGAFTIEFVGGPSVRLGRDEVDERIDRFFDVAIHELGPTLDEVRYVDMRYSNGFAVPRRESPADSAVLARVESGG
jgi:cell division protein FtsQ